MLIVTMAHKSPIIPGYIAIEWIYCRLGLMMKEAARVWIADWLGRSKTVRRRDKSISPLQVLPQAFAVLALILTNPIAGLVLPLVEPWILFVIRIALLVALSLMAHHVVVAKEVLESSDRKLILPVSTEERDYQYKYTEAERLTSKIAFLVALPLLAIVSWFSLPQPKPCRVNARVENVDASATNRGLFSYVEISGGDQTNQFPLSTTGQTVIEITAGQRKGWVLTIVQQDGRIAQTRNFSGCPNAKKTVPLGLQSILVLQPSKK